MLLGFKASPILESNWWHFDNLVTAPTQMNNICTYNIADLININLVYWFLLYSEY